MPNTDNISSSYYAQKPGDCGDPGCGKGSAAFQANYFARDLQAGIVTGVMAIPLSMGIAMMSSYPIKVGLATVAFASLIGWLNAWFRPGNYIGCPGIAAGLAPVLAMGVAAFGIENMAFIVFLTAVMQAVIWKFNWQKYILQAVPTYLVEGLLAGIGLQIALKFIPFTYEIPAGLASAAGFWNMARVQMCLISLAAFVMFIYLFSKYKHSRPAIPYFTLIVVGVGVAQFINAPLIVVEDVDIKISFPLPHFENYLRLVYAIGYAFMLAVIDVTEQVMSNAAIEKLDPLNRKCNSNNSLRAIWIANMGASFFGGMTNLDGLAKSTTNALAGAYTKFSILVVGCVVTFFFIYSQYLEYLPKFSLAAIMIFTGWKMILGLLHVAHLGKYPLMLAILCGILVYELGIFEGLLISLAIHGAVNYIIFYHVDKLPNSAIIRKYFDKFSDGGTY